MKPVLIDTNLLYDLAGVNDDLPSKIDFSKLRTNIEPYKPFVISEVTYLEFLTHDFGSREKKEKVKNYICDNRLEIEFSQDDINTFLKKIDGKDIHDKEVISEAFKLKVFHESQTLVFSVAFTLYFFYYFLYLHVENECSKSIFTGGAAFYLYSEMMKLRDNSKKIIEDHYSKALKIKETLVKIIKNEFDYIFLLYELALQNKGIADYNPDSFTSNSTIRLFELKNTIRKFNIESKGLLRKEEYSENYKKCKTFLKQNFPKIFPGQENFVDFYLNFAESFFKDGRKFNKNDFIDSLLNIHANRFSIFSFDEYYMSTIKDRDYYSILKDLYDSVKI